MGMMHTIMGFKTIRNERVEIMKGNNLTKRMAGVLAAVMMASAPLAAMAEQMDYEVVIRPQYEAAEDFSGGYAAVKKDGKWGYIDADGKNVVDFKYDYASDFREGKAIVGTCTTNEYGWNTYFAGFVDETGAYTPFMYRDSYDNKEKQFEFQDELYITDEDGKSYTMKYCFYNGYVSLWLGGGQYLIFGTDGKAIDNNLGEYTYLSGLYSEGLFQVSIDASYPENQDYYDINKNLILSFPGGYESAGIDGFRVTESSEFHNGYAAGWAYPVNGSYDDTYVVLLDKTGHIAFARRSDYISYCYACGTDGVKLLNSGLIMLNDPTTGKYGAVDMQNNIHIPFEYDMLLPLSEGLALMKKGDLWGYVDASGKVIIEPQYTSATSFFNGIAFALKDGQSVAIDRYNNVFTGSDKIPMDYYVNDKVIHSAAEMMIVKETDKYGYAKLSYENELPQAAEMSAWAYPEVVEAIQKNLVPMYLQNSYFSNITREDFAQLIVSALEEVSGKTASELVREKTGIAKKDLYNLNPFNDTSDINVIIANKLGIINGISDTAFAPGNEISRQDAAALLMRAAQLLSGNIEEVEPTFADNDKIADYAKKAVSYVTTLKIMNGVGDDRFDPTAKYTREQAYVTIVRLFNSLKSE